MASETKNILAAFYDEGAYTPLFGAGEGAVSAAFGLVGGSPAYAVCQNGEAVSACDVALCTKTTELAAKTGNPVVTFYNSKGAKLADGIAALTAAAKLNEAAAKISGVVPQIAVVTGVCGASSAMAAANADICVMAKDAELFLTAPFLSAAAGDKVEGAGSAESAVKAGVASVVAEDAEAAAKEAARLVMLLPGNNLSAAGSFEYAAPTAPLAKAEGMDAVEALVDDGSAVELSAGFGGCCVATALATISGAVVGVVATKGADTQLGNKGITKIARFVRLCDAFSIPVVTVVNTGGFAVSSSNDEAGAIRGAARLAATYADATTAKVAVLAGKAVGSAYAALGSADLTVAVEGCVVTPAEPTAAVTVLYKEEIEASDSIEGETAKRAAAYAAEVGGASALLEAGVADFTATAATARAQVAAALDILVSKRTQRIAKKHGNMAL